jgi:hypothetical protein
MADDRAPAPAPPSGRPAASAASAGAWLDFRSYLALQRGLQEERAAAAPDNAGRPSTSGRPAEAAPAPALAPRPRPGAALPRDCRTETRHLGAAPRARRELTLMLAAPGVPVRDSPLLEARQAGALVAALAEPLVTLPAGRLTRRLEAPAALRPTGERGALGLWLLANDDVVLVWQAGGAGVAAAGAALGPAGAAAAAAATPGAAQLALDLAVWEEVARFPAGAPPLLDDAPLVTVHMLRGDASGRAFYIRPRADVARAHAGGAGDAGGPPTAPGAAAPDAAPRLYFWLAGADLGAAVHALGRLKSLLKRPPTLARRAGVPEAQLAQLGGWLRRAGAAAAAPPGAPAPAAPALPVLRRLPDGRLAATATVSATAATLHRDRRFGVACPTSVSVGVSVALAAADGGGGAGRRLAAAAAARARTLAEAAAREAADRSGRRAVEERACESLLAGARTARAAARAERAARRAERAAAAEPAPLLRALEGAAAVEATMRAVLPMPLEPSSGSSSTLASPPSERADHNGGGGAPPPPPGGRVTIEDLRGLFSAAAAEGARAAAGALSLSDLPQDGRRQREGGA